MGIVEGRIMNIVATSSTAVDRWLTDSSQKAATGQRVVTVENMLKNLSGNPQVDGAYLTMLPKAGPLGRTIRYLPLLSDLVLLPPKKSYPSNMVFLSG